MNYYEQRQGLKVRSLMLIIMVVWAFLFHNILHAFSIMSYVMAAAGICCLGIVTKTDSTFSINNMTCAWIPAIIAMFSSYFLHSTKKVSAEMDILILFIAMVFCIFSFYDKLEYMLCMKVIVFISAIHSFGVIIQQFLPSLYQVLVKFLPDTMQSIVLQSKYNGFTTNPGFAAAFICAGLIALITILVNDRKITFWNRCLLILMIAALLFTNKRAHPVFLGIALLLCWLLPVHNDSRINKYWKIFLTIVGIIVFFFAFKDFLVRIPFVSSIVQTIDGLMLGTDVTSSRSDLSSWAWSLFKDNPVFGIGWGDYRSTIIGTITHATELDTHNIYLQLLCETGIVGFVCFVVPFVLFWTKAKNAYCKCAVAEDELSKTWKPPLCFSFVFQTLFLIYGLTGNPLYDPNWMILYMFACGITMSFVTIERQSSEEDQKKEIL